MASIDLTLTVRKRWFYPLAAAACLVGIRLGLIRSRASAERWGGVAEAEEVAAEWLVDHAMVFEVR
jgi:hypothetical protein